MPKVPDAVRMFVPERWGTVDYFSKFYSTTYDFDAVQRRGVEGVKGHFDKAQHLLVLAQKLRPGLALDHAELEEHGFTEAYNSSELATVIEAAMLELYSTIDCAAKIIHAIHGRTTPGFRNSTRSLFQRIDKISGSIPIEIRDAIANATWYNKLLYLRDELTHLTPGACHLDTETSIVWYRHGGIKEKGKDLIIDDIFVWLHENLVNVNHFIGLVFHHLSLNLNNEPVYQICGMVEGRILHRYIRPEPPITFGSGECGAWVWFEQSDLPTCPFVQVCDAYTRKAPPVR